MQSATSTSRGSCAPAPSLRGSGKDRGRRVGEWLWQAACAWGALLGAAPIVQATNSAPLLSGCIPCFMGPIGRSFRASLPCVCQRAAAPQCRLASGHLPPTPPAAPTHEALHATHGSALQASASAVRSSVRFISSCPGASALCGGRKVAASSLHLGQTHSRRPLHAHPPAAVHVWLSSCSLCDRTASKESTHRWVVCSK